MNLDVEGPLTQAIQIKENTRANSGNPRNETCSAR